MYLFISGCQRSGTTLLRTILSNHSEISILPETHVYTILKGKIDHKYENVIQYYFEVLPEFNSGWLLPENEKVLKNLKNNININKKIDNEGELLKSILQKYSEFTNKNIVGEKTPPHIYFIDKINTEIEDSKFIIIHRDPRAVALSEKKKLNKRGKERDYSFLKIFVRWLSSVHIGNSYNRDNLFIINFEDLVSEPQRTVEALCNYMGVNFEPSMLNVTVVNSSFEDTNKIEGISEEKINLWESNLNCTEGLLLEYGLEKEMNYLGYNPHFKNLQNINPIKKNALKILSKLLRIVTLVVVNNKKLLQKYYLFK